MLKTIAIVFVLSLLSLMSSPLQTFAQDCSDLLPPRLNTGDIGKVITPDANNMRDRASTSGALIDSIPSEARFDVVSGAVCADGYYWYQIDFQGVLGWTAESGGGEYWIAELAPGEPANLIDSMIRDLTTIPLTTVRVALDGTGFTLAEGQRARIIAYDGLVSLREGATFSAPIVDLLPDATEFFINSSAVEADGVRWVGVLLDDGQTGYVAEGVGVNYEGSSIYSQHLFPACEYTEDRLALQGAVAFYNSDDEERRYAQTQHHVIYTMGQNGENPCVIDYMHVPFNTFESIAWSQDGTTLAYTIVESAFMIGGRSEDNIPMRIRADGMVKRQIGTPRDIIDSFYFSPDGSQIIYTALDENAGGIWDLMRVDFDGTNEMALINGEEAHSVQLWLDNRIYFLMRGVGIQYLDLDAGQIITLVNAPDFTSGDLIVSETGMLLYYHQ